MTSKAMSEPPKKVILVTGGSRGIGQAIVQLFKKQGWLVATCAREARHLDKSVADLKLSCDVTQPDKVRKQVTRVYRTLGRIDVLVNNAGLTGNNPLEPDTSDDLWHRIIDVNLHGTYYFCKQVAPLLPEKTGKIINIASVLAFKGVPDATAYCAAKHAVLGLTRGLAGYLAPRQISVNAICPGWVRTAMGENRLKEMGLTELEMQASVPLARWIEPQEIADFVFYLATAKGGAPITGQGLTIDGGMLA